jgi:hypothetical protein
MAKWICAFCLIANPIFVISCQVFFFEFWDLPLDIGIVVVLIVSGQKLKRLAPYARQWVTYGLYASLAIDAFEFWASMFITTKHGTGSESVLVFIALLFALLLVTAYFIFRIVAIAWLHRHGHELPVDKGAFQ